jgi:hypothetical protein
MSVAVGENTPDLAVVVLVSPELHFQALVLQVVEAYS